MEQKKQIAYDSFYVGILSVALLCFWSEYVLLAPVSRLHLLWTAVAVAVWVMLRHMKAKGRILIGGITVILTVSLLYGCRRWNGWEWLQSNLWIFYLLAFPLPGLFVTMLLNRFVKMKYILAGMDIAINLLFLLFHVNTPKTGIATLLFLMIPLLVEMVQDRWRKSGEVDRVGHLVHVTVFLAPFLAILLLLPTPGTPYNWDWAKHLWDRTRTGVEELSYRVFGNLWEEYESGATGYSDMGSIGNLVTGNNKTLMTVEPSQASGRVIYLTGKIFDAFDGRAWTQSEMEAYPTSNLDVLEILSTIYAKHYGELNDYMKSARISVTYDNYSTKHIFTPAKVREIVLKDAKYSAKEENGIYLFDRKKSPHITYEVGYYRFNKNHDVFKALVEECEADAVQGQAVTEQNWNQILLKYPGKKTSCSYAVWQQYRDMVFRYYGEKVELSERAWEYLKHVNADAESTYDKLRKLEEALWEYSYDTSVEALPENITDATGYLDYFLFDSQAGYCSHYATAFVLLARAQGIPCRYVQGYRVEVESGTALSVTGENAHAWPEAYIEGIGWIPFEPTPGYSRETIWQTNAERKAVEQQFREDNMHHDEEPVDREETEEPVTTEYRKLSPVWMLIPIVFVLLFAVMVVYTDWKLKEKRYEKLDTRDKTLQLCRRNLKILTMLELPMEAGETLLEYKKRILTVVDNNAVKFLDAYQKLCYAKADDAEVEESLKIAQDSNFALCVLLKEKTGVWYLLYYIRQ